MYRFIFLFIFLFISCKTFYTGSFDQPNLNLEQPEELSAIVSKWEDGNRTTGKSNEFEWWYFDTKLNNGALLVCYFYKVHFLQDKYFIGLNYNDDEEDIFLLKYFNKNEVQFSSDSCDVIMGNNYIRGNLNQYEIKLDPKDFEGFGVELFLKSNLKPYRPKDGIIKAGNDFFAWLAAVPNGTTKGTVIIDGIKKNVNGDGYHDHNWGNTPLQKLFDGWSWFRGKVGDHTIIASELNLSDKRGGSNIPILYIANQDSILTNRFGENGVYTKYTNLINNLYPKKNEPLFSSIKFLTEDGFLVSIEGKKLIDNSEIFKRMNLPSPIRWVMNKNGIDPYYSRFKSDVKLSIDGNYLGNGFGILEIMDLK